MKNDPGDPRGVSHSARALLTLKSFVLDMRYNGVQVVRKATITTEGKNQITVHAEVDPVHLELFGWDEVDVAKWLALNLSKVSFQMMTFAVVITVKDDVLGTIPVKNLRVQG
jgi:hypothetical protein